MQRERKRPLAHGGKVALAALLLSGCGSSSSRSSDAAAAAKADKDFYLALDASDGKTACALLDPSSLGGETVAQCVSYVSRLPKGSVSSGDYSQSDKARDSAAQQYLAIAWKAAVADSVIRPHGDFQAGAKLVAAIHASEPELTVRLGDLAAAKASTSPATVFVDPRLSSAQRLVLYARSDSGRVFEFDYRQGQSTAVSAKVVFAPAAPHFSLAKVRFVATPQGKDFVVRFTLPGVGQGSDLLRKEGGQMKIALSSG